MWASLFCRFAILVGAKIVGVTGTRGKTTTTEIICHVLKKTGKKIIAGGNLRGKSILSNLPRLSKDTVVVLELDSWKLQGFAEEGISPNISVFTNFLLDHMNYYKDTKDYFLDKANIFRNQKKGDVLIANWQIKPFLEKWCKPRNTKVIYLKERDCKIDGLKIPGVHNALNACLAKTAVKQLGIKESVIDNSLKTFKGVPGRLEFVRDVDGVKYYNDTTATTEDAVISALNSFDSFRKKIILIMGGSDKGLSVNRLLKKIPVYAKKVILLKGSGTEKIKNKIKGAVVVNSMNKAVNLAKSFASSEDLVLLSPAFASFGMFNNEYDRGDQFVASVKKLR